MEKLADAGVHTDVLEDLRIFISVAQHLRQTGIFGLFMKGLLRQGFCDRCMEGGWGAAWPKETFMSLTFLKTRPLN